MNTLVVADFSLVSNGNRNMRMRYQSIDVPITTKDAERMVDFLVDYLIEERRNNNKEVSSDRQT